MPPTFVVIRLIFFSFFLSYFYCIYFIGYAFGCVCVCVDVDVDVDGWMDVCFPSTSLLLDLSLSFVRRHGVAQLHSNL